MIYPVILCGGSGTRLWPLSRKSYPKQFLDLTGSGNTMLQETVLRLRGLENVGGVVLVCNAEHRFMVAQQMQDIKADVAAILLEPEAKNTAPAVACAALKLAEKDSDAQLLVLPADHVIDNAATFVEAAEHARRTAELDYLVTFGITPTAPETGYGYIKKGTEKLGNESAIIEQFVEKPDQETAQQYLDEGCYLWNSGMFVFKAQMYLNVLRQHAPAMAAACERAVAEARQDLDFTCLDADAFSQCPSDSIDYAVMEKASKRAVVDLDAGWSDVGSWSSLWDISSKDGDGNASVGDVLSVQSNNSFVYSDKRLVTTLGVNNVVIIDTDDAILVADKDHVQDVKQVVSLLAAGQRSEAENHQTVHRPWGSYTSICSSERFQVKRIVVGPGQKLSLQKHHHRAEHWIVVSGTAKVTCEDKVFTLSEDESTYIPLGHKHRLENPGKIPLELIEVQSGSYLGEDDIVRYDDVYGREDS